MDADVAIVGAGTMGSMAAWRLAERGVRVIAFDRFAPGHDRGAHGGETRIFRTAYLEGAQYVPILQEAKRGWRALEAASGRTLLDLNGGLMIAPGDSALVRTVLRCIDEFQLDHEVLDTDQAARRWPQQRYLPGEQVVLDRDAGFLRPEVAVNAAAHVAEDRGATILRHHRVRAIDASGEGVRIETGEETFRVARAIVAPGAWAGALLPSMAQVIEPRRLIMTWYLARDIASFAPARFPIFVREVGGVHFSGMPSVDGAEVKVALNDAYGAVADPDHLDRGTGEQELEAINRVVAAYFPGLDPEPSRINVYQDGYTPDRHGVLGRAPGNDKLILACGFSGHGFKMSPALGTALADLAMDEAPAIPLGHLAPERFLSGVSDAEREGAISR